jgi:amino acid adenylation domain-containing protein
MNNSRTDSSLPFESKTPLAFGETTGFEPSQGRGLGTRLEYWRKNLSDAPALILPIAKPGGQAAVASQYQIRSSSLPAALTESLRQLSRDEQVPLSAVLLSALYALVVRYSSQEDLTIGCSLPLARFEPLDPQHGSEKTEVLLRIDASGDPAFLTLLQLVNAGLEESLPQACPLSQLLSGLKTTPIFRTGNFPVWFCWKTSGRPASGAPALSASAPVDLCLEIGEEDLQLRLFYNPRPLDANVADRFLSNFQILLSGIAENPKQKISGLPLLTEAETRQMLVEWNRTAREYPRQKCLPELIEAQAERLPGKTAVEWGARELSYSEFNAKANRLAHYLQSKGAGPGERVALCLNPSLEFVIAVLAVLKSGAACVPLDPNYPRDRIAYMLEDAQPRVVITRQGILSDAAEPGWERVFLTGEDNFLFSQPENNPQSGATPEDIAYVIYTSGSTGKPRGVLLTHAGFVNYGTNAARMYGMTPNDRVLQFCSISFDIAVEELLITWLSGATLVLRTEETPLAIPEFLDWLEPRRITVLDLPTAYWHEWVHELPQLKRAVTDDVRLVIVGGEKPSARAYGKWLERVGRGVRWINTYGPTEITICATAFEPEYESADAVPENIPIGRPLANARVYLLDRRLNPVPVGVPGELHVAGVGVARGYLNRPELTAEKFIPDPFSPDAGARLYKTGDLARYLPEGDIEFLGRKDEQIKIRGFRIELGEIEATLGRYRGIREVAVVALQQGEGDKQLGAYFVCAPEAKVTPAELRRYLREQLPEYMVPSAFVALDAMPLTPNGKINRRGLPAPQIELAPEKAEAAQNALQARLVKIWEDVLGKRPIGIGDNFFELGGHSILAARLMHRIGQAQGKTLPLAMLFRAPNIQELAAVLGKDEWAEHWSSLVPIQPLGFQPPFFCIHGVGGNVVGFQRLARHMSPDYPFYGLQSQGLDGKKVCFTSLESMAAHYIAEMRSVQPRGPYFLGGFSFGGLVGYEIAQQLRVMGEAAALLVLFDTYPGDVKVGATSFLRILLKPSRQHWLHDVPRAVGKKLRRTWRNLSVPKALWDVHNANRAAAAKYLLRPYSGKVTLVRATQKPWEGSTDPYAAWNTLAADLVVHKISCDHYDLLLEPRVGELAENLKSWIDHARSEYERRLSSTMPVREFAMPAPASAEDGGTF